MAEEGQVIACHTVDHWKEQFNKAKEAHKLAIVDFTASWCGPCRFIAPIFEQLAKEYPYVVFLKVDVDELESVAEEYKIQAMPTFVYLKDGVEVERLVGVTKEKIVAALRKHATAPEVVAAA